MAERRLTRLASKQKAQTGQPTLHDIFFKKTKTSNIGVNESGDGLPLPSDQANDISSEPKPTVSPPSTSPMIIYAPSINKKSTASAPDKLFPIFKLAKSSNSETNLPSETPVTIDISEDDIVILPQEAHGSHTVSTEEEKPAVPSILEGHSAGNPIILDSSPVKPIRPLTKPRLPARNRPKNVFGHLRLDPLFPDETSQHVRGPQTMVTSSTIPPLFVRTARTRVPTCIQGSQFLSTLVDLDRLDKSPSHNPLSDATSPPESISIDHTQQYPAIRHLLREARFATNKADSSFLWTDKWTPRLAEHVLGNEFHALYLRDWLKALEIGTDPSSHASEKKSRLKSSGSKKRGVKRPKVRREVSKRGKKRQKMDEEDNWVVRDEHVSEAESAGEHEENFGLLDPLAEFCVSDYDGETIPPESPKSTSHLDEHEYDPTPFQYPKPDFSSLSNTIVLCGPSGSGKTAAVYACAAELDWEVFETYPGIGRRNGASLDNLVGEVGRNHLVGKTQSTKASHLSTCSNSSTTTFSSFFSKPNQDPPDTATPELQCQEPLESNEVDIAPDSGFPSHSRPAGIADQAEVKRQVRQSMLLFEEVDILYKEDVNFWPAVINIIKECRRPVILTCNDVSLIPVSELPLQTILYFTACPSPVATSYLQSLCIAEGMEVDSETLGRLSQSYDICSPQDCRTSTRLNSHGSDLRRSIHGLQLYCMIKHKSTWCHDAFLHEESWNRSFDSFAEWPIQVTAAQDDCLQYLRSLDRHMTTVSLVDSGLVADVEERTEEFLNSADDEVGYRCLAPEHSGPSNSTFRRDDVSMAHEALTCSRNMFGSSSLAVHLDRFCTRNPELDTACAHHRSSMMDAQFESLRTVSLCDTGLFLDYEPFLRQSIHFDNSEKMANVPNGGRQTRNSQRTNHVPWVQLSAYQRERLEQTGFRME